MQKTSLGIFEIAKFCEVAPSKIRQWMADGKIPFFQSEEARQRAWASDILAFLKSNKMPIPKELWPILDLKILIVDDEEPVRAAIRRVIGTAYPKAAFCEARDGTEAETHIKNFAPDIVVLDLAIPAINGFGIIKMIRGNEESKGIIIFCVSGRVASHQKESVIRAGADEFIDKPFLNKDFLAAFDSLFKKWVTRGKG